MRVAIRHIPRGEYTAAQTVLHGRPFSAESVIQACLSGFFPMPDEEGRLRWRRPEQRAVMPIDDFHVPKSDRRIVRQQRFEIRINTAFDEVIRGCAAREQTWITPEVITVYRELFDLGLVRTVESWQNGELVGGVYGLSFGRFFAGESQFFRVKHAGKVAYITLMEILRANHYELHDCQFLTQHLAKFGAFEIPHEEFERRLVRAIVQPAEFRRPSSTFDDVIEAGGSRTKSSTAHWKSTNKPTV